MCSLVDTLLEESLLSSGVCLQGSKMIAIDNRAPIIMVGVVGVVSVVGVGYKWILSIYINFLEGACLNLYACSQMTL